MAPALVLLSGGVVLISLIGALGDSIRRRWLLPSALCVLGLLPLAACSSQRRTAQRGLTSGNHEFAIRHGGRRRTYLVHVPPGASPAALPVLLAFHGGGGNASGFQLYAELDRVADRERFLVVYPNGTGPLPNRLLTWNAGDGCCGYALTNSVNDMGFIATLLNDLEQRARIDRNRVYATGHSNGGILAHRFAAERSGLVAAIAPVAGALDLGTFAPTRAVPVLQIHSVDDPRALYNGGLGPPFPGTDNRVMHQPVQEGLDRWIAANGCSTRADTIDTKRDGGQTATLLVWRGCRDGAEVAHWKLTGSGHGWPGEAAPAGGEALAGPQTRLIRAADEIWRFVSRFRLP
ncbi:MAG TPA: PHB depolymerase family esterase [Gemmatimonadaceae bacterium]